MKTILVLSSHPDFSESVRSCLDEGLYRVVHRASLEEAEPLLAHSLANVCLLDADFMGVETIWAIDRIRRHNKKIPIIAFTGSVQADWEEEAFLRGVNHVLAKPVRQRLLLSLLDRLWATPAATRAAASVSTGSAPMLTRPAAEPAVGGRFVNASQTLDVLRGFSPILTHSLDAEAMLKQFLQFLREMLSINRAAVFLNRPASPLAAEIAPADVRRLRSAAALGIGSGLLEHFELSLDSGIGAQVARLGRILRRDSDEARLDPEVQKEFELLGAQVAVPITNRDTTIGVAVFDGRITGEPLVNVELELIFHLLEQVGLALRNIWLHDQLAGNHEMMTAVLRELDSACVVVARDLKVLHANKSARRHFGRRHERTGGGLEFSDLPPALGAKIYQVLKTGAAMEPFRFQPDTAPGTLLKISILPFQHGGTAVPASALLVAEDLTESEQLTRLEAETARLRLLNDMAYRLVNEVGNAIVPLSTHHQLLKESYNDPEFRKSLDTALGEGVKRITRLKNQMHFLARESGVEESSFAVAKVVEEAFEEANRQRGGRGAQLKLENPGAGFTVTGDRAAVKHALAEIMLNALQASPQKSSIGVRLQPVAGGGAPALAIEVQDAGGGFSEDAAKQATAPFYSQRDVGLGLGLTVSRKIIEHHHGKLEIIPSPSGVVRVVLPLDKPAA